MVRDRLRLFVAVEIPQRVRKAVDAAAAPLQRKAPDAKWTDPAHWHLTLAFLGWVEADRQSAVERACAAAAPDAGPFELALDRSAGMFGRRVLWVGLEGAGELAALASALRAALAGAGFETDDRPFRAHLTLARARKGAQLPRGLDEAYRGPASRWTVDRFVLMRSRLQRAGAQYSVEAAWRL